MRIDDAKYVISSPNYQQCPTHDVPEYAFIGRSNVGKSSLINMLTGRRGLAKTSQMPGKTLLINHFSINNGEWYIVDLPGYGYASRGKSQRDELRHLIDGYVMFRENMTLLFVLIDVRHAPQRIDMEFISKLGENGVPFALIFTKSDKLSTGAVQRNVEVYKQALLEHWDELPSIFVSSSETGVGRREILDYIENINQQLKRCCAKTDTV